MKVKPMVKKVLKPKNLLKREKKEKMPITEQPD